MDDNRIMAKQVKDVDAGTGRKRKATHLQPERMFFLITPKRSVSLGTDTRADRLRNRLAKLGMDFPRVHNRRYHGRN